MIQGLHNTNTFYAYFMKGGYIYILSNKTRTVLYTGVTSNLSARTYEHRFEKGSQFTSMYDCNELLYYKFYDSIEEAIDNEKKIKNWKREWKPDLIKVLNPKMKDLYNEVRDLV